MEANDGWNIGDAVDDVHAAGLILRLLDLSSIETNKVMMMRVDGMTCVIHLWSTTALKKTTSSIRSFNHHSGHGTKPSKPPLEASHQKSRQSDLPFLALTKDSRPRFNFKAMANCRRKRFIVTESKRNRAPSGYSKSWRRYCAHLGLTHACRCEADCPGAISIYAWFINDWRKMGQGWPARPENYGWHERTL